MIIRSIFYSIACLTILLSISGSPSSESKAQACLVSTQKSHPKAVILDFGEVVITTNALEACKQLYLPDVAYYIVRSGTIHVTQSLRAKLYEILNKVEPVNHNHPATLDEQGILLPELFHQWLAGIQSPTAIKNQVLAAIEQHPEWFDYEVEKRIIKRMITMIFTPKLLAQSRKIVDGAIEFVRECKEQGYKVYGLSNWDPESIQYIKAQHKEFFDLFDGVCISGEEGCTKPDPRIYKCLLKKFNLKAHECWFVDDQKENIAEALACGIHGMICPQKGFLSPSTDFDALRYQLV